MEKINKTVIKQKAKNSIFKTIFSRSFIFCFLLLFQIFAYFILLSSVIISGSIKYIFLIALTVIIGFFIINKTDDQMYTITWLFIILGFPVFGLFIYLFVNLQPQAKKLKKIYIKEIEETKGILKKDENIYSGIEEKNIYNLANYIYKYSGTIIDNNSELTYFASGVEKFKQLKEDLKNAKKFIFMEYFIIGKGKMWNEILEILIQKAKENIEIRLLYDGTCSFSRLPTRYPQELKQLGINCKVFSPIRPILTTYQNNRDHRKIVVIDGEIAYTGGINLADEYIEEIKPYGRWKDSAVRIKGNAVKDFTFLFLQIWNMKEKIKDDFYKYININHIEKSDGYIVGYGDSPYINEKIGQNIYLSMINSATEYIHIMTPYLIPSYELIQALKFAAQRGIDVKIIMPHVPDKKYAFWLARTYYQDLIDNNVKIYEWKPGFVHSKVFIVDGKQATVGSINLDFRSLFLHLECGCYIYKNSQIEKIESDYIETLSDCIFIDNNFMRAIPKYQIFLGKLLKLFAPLL